MEIERATGPQGFGIGGSKQAWMGFPLSGQRMIKRVISGPGEKRASLMTLGVQRDAAPPSQFHQVRHSRRFAQGQRQTPQVSSLRVRRAYGQLTRTAERPNEIDQIGRAVRSFLAKSGTDRYLPSQAKRKDIGSIYTGIPAICGWERRDTRGLRHSDFVFFDLTDGS